MKKSRMQINTEDLYLIGKYIAGLYRLNYFVVAGYVAGNTFENIINVFLDKQGLLNITSDTHDSLHEKIKRIDIDIIRKQFHIPISTNRQLIEIKNIRNDIVHGFIRDVDKEKIRNLVEFVWSVTKKSNDPELNELDMKAAQYWIRDFEVISEKDTEKGYSQSSKQIRKSDFYDLYRMRSQLKSFEDYVSSKKRLGKYYKYKVDNVSAVNPTSAYVWLAIVEAESKSRKKIFEPSISVLSTPLDIRIYLDFGGLAFDYREKYYKFLNSVEISSISIDKKDLYLFDIDWYSFFGERYKFDDFFGTEVFDKKIKEAFGLVRKAKKENIPIAWNKLLIGYVFQRDRLPEGIGFDEIWSRIEYIIKLYEVFKERIVEIDKQKPNYIYSEAQLKKQKLKKGR